RGRVRLLRKHRDTFTLPGFVPGAFTLGLCAGPLVGLLSAWLMAAYLGCVGLYALLVLAVSAGISWKARDVRLLPWTPLVFLAVHLGAGWGILLEALRPGRPPDRTRLPQPVPKPAPTVTRRDA